MPKTLTPEQMQFVMDNPVIMTPDPGILAEDAKLPVGKRRYERWKCRYANYECIIRHARNGRDPITDQPTKVPGRRVKFKEGECFIWKDDPEYDMIVGVLRRRPDFHVKNLVCVDDIKTEDGEEVEAEFLGQKESIPLQRLGVHPSRMGAVQKILNRQASKREAEMKARIKDLEAQVEASKKAGEKPVKETKANGTDL